jgi:hypothetical protein
VTDPQPIETTRLGGGISWKLGLAVVSVVLVGVAGIGIAGRPPASTRPAVADAATAQPGPTTSASVVGSPLTSPTTGTRGPVIRHLPAGPTAEVGGGTSADVDLSRGDYAVVAKLAEREFSSRLARSARGGLTATLKIPIPPPATDGTVELVRIWSTVSHDAWAPIASWPLRREALSAASGREYVVLGWTISGRPIPARSNIPIVNGFRITIRAQSGIARGILNVEIDKESPRHQLVGDDGIFGWPSVALLQSRSRHVPAPRGVYNFCRWDIGPMALPPRPGTDESNCGG